MVAWFKKTLPPIITAYSRRAGWDDMRSSIREQLDSMGIDAFMFEWAQKVSTQWWVEILHEYLVWWEWYDINAWNDGYVVVLTNANKDILWIEFKSRTELWSETFYNLKNAFEMAETDMTDAIWSMCMSWFSLTLTVSTSAGVTTISDGSQSIIVNSISHNMKYDKVRLMETSDTSTEYSTLSTNWRLVDWTYTYPASGQEVADWSNIVASLKTKWIVNPTITHDTVNWKIIIANWTYHITMADKNLWATTVYENGDTLSEANCWKMYQWWNNYWFSWNWTVTTSSTKINTSSYWPWNYYSSDTYTVWDANSTDWSTSQNDNLRWDVSNTEYARQWPCPSWWHIPSKMEFENLIEMFIAIRPNAHTWDDFKNAFAMPYGWLRWRQDASLINQPRNGYSLTSSPYGGRDAALLQINSIGIMLQDTQRSMAWPIRPFKNTYTLIPINQLWSEFWDTTDIQNEMNSHPYDYYLLGWSTTPLTLASWAWAMRRVYASYDSNTNTWEVQEVS